MNKVLEETEKFLNKHCLQKCNHNSNESCICKVAICLKEIERAQEQERIIDKLKTLIKYADLNKQKIISLQVLKHTLKEVL